ncbi:MAG: DNA topoisomerase IB, partial [Solirubrobacteraceae bacterium]
MDRADQPVGAGAHDRDPPIAAGAETGYLRVVPRLRRSNPADPGISRARRGRGFSYHDRNGARIEAPEVLTRIGQLAIPPAWRDVWICADPLGHLQATGVDAAGRTQYLYHERWRELRDRQKFEQMTEFARRLPALRRWVSTSLRGEEPTRERVLACAIRLLDIGLFRIGSEQYASEDGGVGLATLCREHVSFDGPRTIRFDYPAKSGVRRVHTVSDARCAELLRTLARRRSGEQLLAYRSSSGERWTPIHSDDVNEQLKERIGREFSAKDFRTWNATVAAAAFLAAHRAGAAPARGAGRRPAVTGGQRVVKAAVK